MKKICFDYAEFLESHKFYLMAEFSRAVGRYADTHTKEQVLAALLAHRGEFYYECTITELQKRIEKV